MEMDDVRVENHESNEVAVSGDSVQGAGLRGYQTPKLRRFAAPQLVRFGSIESVVQASGGTGGDAGASSS